MKSEGKPDAKVAAKKEFAELFLEIGCEEIPAGMIVNSAAPPRPPVRITATSPE